MHLSIIFVGKLWVSYVNKLLHHFDSKLTNQGLKLVFDDKLAMCYQITN